MKKVTFNNGFKNHALFGILGLVLNTRFCAHQNLNVKSLKNDLTHKAMAHLNHVSDQAGISSPGLLRCYFLGQMFRLRPFCVHRSFSTKSFSLGQFIWGVEGILKQHHWTSSLSLDPILHQSIFRLSIQANSLKKSFSKRLFLGTARMNGGHSDANFDDFPKMVDPVPAAADLSEVPREEKMRALQENLKQTCRVFEKCDGFLEKFKEYKMRNDLDSQRVWEAANQEILNKKATENSWAEYDKIARQVLNKDWGFYEEFATLNEEYRDRLRQCMEVLKNLREELEPGQDDDIKKQIETYLERWNLKIEADYSFPLKTLHKLPRALKGFRKEVLEPIGNMYYVAHKRRDQRWDEKFAEATKFSTSFDIKTKRIQEELESTTDFCESEQNEEEQWLGPIGLEALFSGFKNF